MYLREIIRQAVFTCCLWGSLVQAAVGQMTLSIVHHLWTRGERKKEPKQIKLISDFRLRFLALQNDCRGFDTMIMRILLFFYFFLRFCEWKDLISMIEIINLKLSLSDNAAIMIWYLKLDDLLWCIYEWQRTRFDWIIFRWRRDRMSTNQRYIGTVIASWARMNDL